MLTRDTFVGPWAGLPVAWTDDDRFDEETYRGDVVRCCEARMPGVYTGGTTGEFYAMEFDEFQSVARATVEECQIRDTPAMIGCSSTYTLGVVRRAEYAASIGADAIQVALPFWMEVGDAQVVRFFEEVSRAADGLAFSIYETTRAKVALSLDQHRAIRDAVPSYMMVKANAGTIGATPNGCEELAKFVNVFVGEGLWGSLGPRGARGCCSSVVYWNPRVCLEMWHELDRQDWAAVEKSHERIKPLFEFLDTEFGPKEFTDTAFDRMGGVASGFLKTSLRSRAPYPFATEEDVATLRQWYKRYFPAMLEL
ncbi:MAG: dihydrodipicolinate synthase family protein [Planctomycetes bacterium]|nr:dihydrodipicolinate synthase family protein [Planctomycetota bacterium]